jgi:hypothetical protein
MLIADNHFNNFESKSQPKLVKFKILCYCFQRCKVNNFESKSQRRYSFNSSIFSVFLFVVLKIISTFAVQRDSKTAETRLRAWGG